MILDAFNTKLLYNYTFDPFDRYNITCTVDSNCDYAKYMHEYGQSLNPAYIRCAITIWGVGRRDNQLHALYYCLFLQFTSISVSSHDAEHILGVYG